MRIHTVFDSIGIPMRLGGDEFALFIGLKKEAQKELDDAVKEILDGREEIKKGEKEIEEINLDNEYIHGDKVALWEGDMSTIYADVLINPVNVLLIEIVSISSSSLFL